MNLKDIIARELNINLSEEQLRKFDIYYQELATYNKHTNITRIVNEEEIYFKHFLDSLALSRIFDFTKDVKLADMGSGAGFPAIPLKIVFPKLKITLIDSIGKKTTFLEIIKNKLSLNDVEIVNERIEDYARNNHETFDVVTARALGKLNYILELGTPMLKTKGAFIAMKSQGYQEELDDAKNACDILHIELEKNDTFDLPNNEGVRTNLLFVKKKHNNQYPRTNKQMTKKPL